jgi:hypothetical protein
MDTLCCRSHETTITAQPGSHRSASRLLECSGNYTRWKRSLFRMYASIFGRKVSKLSFLFWRSNSACVCPLDSRVRLWSHLQYFCQVWSTVPGVNNVGWDSIWIMVVYHNLYST